MADFKNNQDRSVGGSLARQARLALLAGLLALAGTVSAVTISVSPASVTNGYTGEVTLTITGLTNRETVFLDKFLDLNSNGVVNAGEPLVQRFRVTDGASTTIGGVTNLNVPGDADVATNAQIVARLNLAAASEANRLAGAFRFRVSSPSGRFTAVEAAFTITQPVLGQAITGTVYSGSAGILSNALVLAQHPYSGEYLSGAIAASNGVFHLQLPPGACRVVALRNGAAVGQQGTGPIINLAPGATNALNLTNTAGALTISGTLKDEATADALPGVQILLTSSNGAATIAFTDAAGGFSAPVTSSGEWAVSPSLSAVSQLGYLAASSPAVVSTLAGNISTNLRLPRATSLLYGAVRNETGQPLAGAAFAASDTLASYTTGRGLSLSNGSYSLGLQSGSEWCVVPDLDLLARLGFVGMITNAGLATNQALPRDLRVHSVNAHLLGTVLRDDSAPLAGVEVLAYSVESAYLARAFTDANGGFDLGLFGGQWTVFLGSSSLAGQNLVVPILPPVDLANNSTTSNYNATLWRIQGAIAGSVLDTNSGPITFVPVHAVMSSGGFDYQVDGTTDALGGYFLPAFNGSWVVEVGDLSTLGHVTPSSQQTTINNSTNTVSFVAASRGPLAIITVSLPAAFVGSPYAQLLQSVGGALPHSWSIVAGSLGNLSLDSSGLIWGTPLSVGTNTFTARVIDNFAIATNKTFSIVVTAPAWLAISLPHTNGTVSVQLTGRPSTGYVLESATNLVSSSWTPAATSSSPSGVIVFTNLPATAPASVFRAREQ